MSKTVYFVRHGECIANLKGLIAGGADDSPLTELGKKQAKETAKKLMGIDFDIVISSPMSRALNTAQIINETLGLNKEISIKSEFTERNAGEFTGKPKEEYLAFEEAGGETVESTTDMQNRVQNGLRWLKEQDFNNALVVTHNGTIHMIRTVLENLPAKNFANLPQLNNGEYLKVELV